MNIIFCYICFLKILTKEINESCTILFSKIPQKNIKSLFNSRYILFSKFCQTRMSKSF
nr:MAG TPA: hypothetical protein [Caudoviricetes sp.]